MKNKLLLALLCLGLALFLKCTVHAQTGTPKTFTASTVGQTVTELSGSVPGGNTMTFLANGFGCGGCVPPTNGQITSFNQNTGTAVYKPNAGFIGTDSFTYIVRATPTGGGSSTDSSQITINIVVTNATTTVTGKLTDLGVMAITGKVALVMGSAEDSPSSIIPRTKTVIATLDGTGRFTTAVYPSVALFPASVYTLIYIDSVTLRQEKIGVYNIPASTATVDLSTCNCRVLDAAQDAKLSFATRASLDALITQVQAADYLDNGTPAATRRVVNIIPGSGITTSVVDNSGSNRVDVTISCASCTGGSLASGTTGRPLVYTSNTVAGGAAFTGAHRLWTSNATNNGMEFKSIACSGGITCTPTAGQLAIVGTVQGFTLNTQTGNTQTLSVAFTGSTSPTWNSSANIHTLILPDAAANVTHGLWTNGTQTSNGAKTFTSSNSNDVPATFQEGLSGSSTVTLWKTLGGTIIGSVFASDASLPSTVNGMYMRSMGLGDGLSAPPTNEGTGVLYISESAGAAALNGIRSHIISTQGNSGIQMGIYSRRFLDGTGNYSSQFNSSVRGELTWSGSSTLTKGNVFRGEFLSDDSGTAQEANVFASYATWTNGVANNFAHFRATAPVGSGFAVNIYGVYVEDQTAASTGNYAWYSNLGLSSFGDRVDFRGQASASASNVGEARFWMDSNTSILKLSVNGGPYGRVDNPLEGSGNPNFGTISANSCNSATVTVTGALVGNPVWIGIPSSAVFTGVQYTNYRVSATDTVTIEACNYTGSSKTPNTGTFKVRVGQ